MNGLFLLIQATSLSVLYKVLRMNKRIGLLFAPLSLLLLVGCAGPQLTKGPALPEPSQTFTPRLIYKLSRDKAFDVVIKTLNANQIAIVRASKELGQITTDYIQGPSGSREMILETTTQQVRYKFNIFLTEIDKNSTKINVNPLLESSEVVDTWDVDSQTHTQYRYSDVTAKNPQVVNRLRNWLYEKIEQNM
jgi:hypothetical protein